MVDQVHSSDQICHGKNKTALVSIGMAGLVQVPTRSTAAASQPEMEKFVTLFYGGGVMLD